MHSSELKRFLHIPPKSKKLSLRDFKFESSDPIQPQLLHQPPHQPPQPQQLPKPSEPPEPPEPPFEYIDDFNREDAICKIEAWIKKPNKCLLVLGHTGSGKTACIEHYLMKHKHKIDYYDEEENISDFLSNNTLLKKGPGIIEDPESLKSDSIKREDDKDEKSPVKQIEQCLSGNMRHLILVSTDYFAESQIIKRWMKLCTVVKMELPQKNFISKVLKSRSNQNEIIEDIANNCNSNLYTATNSLKWSLLMSKNSDALIMDAPLDVPKAVRLTYMGQKVQCLGGSSDIDYYSRMLQCTLPDTNNLSEISKTMHAFSTFDLSSEVLDNDTKWNFLQMIPKKAAKKFEVLWPKKTSNIKLDFDSKTKSFYEYE